MRLMGTVYFYCYGFHPQFEMGRIYTRGLDADKKTLYLDGKPVRLSQEFLFGRFDEIFVEVDVHTFPDYKKETKLKTFLWKPNYGKSHAPRTFFQHGADRFARIVEELNFAQDRKQIRSLIDRVLIPLAEIELSNEDLYFEFHKTILTSLKTLELFFVELDDDRLTEEVNRVADYAWELKRLNHDLLAKSAAPLLDAKRNDTITQSIEAHRLLLDNSIKLLKEMTE